MDTNDPIEHLIVAFGRLPGVGRKTATRLALHVLRSPPELASELATALSAVRETVRRCERCRTFTFEERCALCRDPARRDDQLCVVESVADLWALERSGAFKGRYHVLHGALSPLDGIGPAQLELDSLLARIAVERPAEVILATSADVNGETTALYIAQQLAGQPPRLTRIATGVPTGGGLEYMDTATLELALTYRRAL